MLLHQIKVFFFNDEIKTSQSRGMMSGFVKGFRAEHEQNVLNLKY